MRHDLETVEQWWTQHWAHFVISLVMSETWVPDAR